MAEKPYIVETVIASDRRERGDPVTAWHRADALRVTEEIIHGKGSGQLKKRVLKFLERPDMKARYARVDKDAKNHGRLFVYFRF